MKTLFTFIVLLFCLTVTAQDKIYVHTATAANISSNVTYIDHPDLNGNPSAKILIAHNANPNGSGIIVFNNHISGVWYDGSVSKWAIFNEDLSSMLINSSYNVYIADPADVIIHVSTAANQGSDGAFETVIDDPDFNGLAGPYAVLTNYWNPFSIYNNINYGFYFDAAKDKRGIYAENGTSNIPTNAAFFILKTGGSGVINRYTHQVDAGNSAGISSTELDNPNLNNNPNATFVFAHYWGVTGTPSQQNINATLGVGYDSSIGRWVIYSEDNTTPIVIGTAFDIIITTQEILATEDNTLTNSIVMSPNPAKDFVTFKSDDVISTVTIYSILGQEVYKIAGNENTMLQIDISNFSTGNYFAKVQSSKGVNTLKLIKQ